MMKWVKTIAIGFVVVFLLWYLVRQPERAADFVKDAFTIIDSLGRFFDRLATP